VALPPGLEVLEQKPNLILAASGSVMFRIWRATATLDSLSCCEAALDSFSAEHGRYGTLTILERDVAAPTPEVRQAAGRMMARFWSQSSNALVIEGTGFKYTGMRLALTTIHLLAPSSMPPSVFAGVEEASEWLAPQLSEVSAALLIRDVATLRGL
jgi:hypothetical protein